MAKTCELKWPVFVNCTSMAIAHSIQTNIHFRISTVKLESKGRKKYKREWRRVRWPADEWKKKHIITMCILCKEESHSENSNYGSIRRLLRSEVVNIRTINAHFSSVLLLFPAPKYVISPRPYLPGFDPAAFSFFFFYLAGSRWFILAITLMAIAHAALFHLPPTADASTSFNGSFAALVVFFS